MTRYVVGFLFDGAGHIALIKKNRPKWQAGFLNGIGGHIEVGEAPAEAMAREFEEETGAKIPAKDWREFAFLLGENAKVWCFTCIKATELQQMTDEQVGWYDLVAINQSSSVLPSLNWLVPMAMDQSNPELMAVIENVAR